MAIPSYPALDAGTYIFDPTGGGYPNNGGGASNGNGPGGPTYVLPANTSTGVSVTSSLSVYNKYVIASEVYTIPSASPYQITVQHGGIQQILEQGGNTTDSVIYQYPADGHQGANGATGGVVYYPSGTALTSKGENGTPTAAGQFGWANTGGQGVYTFSSADAGQQVVIRYLYLSPDYQQFAPTAEAIDFAMGNLGQSPSTYMASKHPDQAVGYSRTALAELDAGYIGASGTLPDYRYEVSGYSVVGGGTLDAHTIDCIYTLLTDSLVGVGVPTDVIDQATWYNNSSSAENWLDSQQFYISEALTSPQSCGSIVGRWLEAFNVAAMWSEGVLKLVPYGDQSTSGTAPYIPDTTVVASFGDDDYIAGENEDPVQMARTSWADAYNRIQVNYSNRANAYYPDLVYEDESGSIERFGLRIKAPDSYPFITTWQLAQNVANMRLKRYTLVRNTYQFTVPITFEYLEPMDLVSLTDTRLGLDALVVRVTKVSNDPAKGLQITCEDWPGNGYAMPVSHPKAAVPASSPTHGTAPAGGTASLILQASNVNQNQTGTKIYIWAGPDSPGMSWGGCTIFVSLDGSTYQQLGGVPHAAGIYQLNSALPSVTANPQGALGLTHDTTSTLSVIPDQVGASAQIQTTAGLSQWDAETDYAAGAGSVWDGLPWIANYANSGSQPSLANPNWSLVPGVSPAGSSLTSITDTAAANLANLCAVIATSGNSPSAVEFLSFATVAASGTNGYALTDLYRGALGTSIGSFATGSAMVAFSEASATWDVPPGLAGQTVYFRFVPWNQFGQATQDLSLAETVEFVVANSGSVGVWEGLGGPIGDVIQNNGGKGELIVNPVGGVSGELPYANHASQVQSVITSGSQIVSATQLSASGTAMSTIDTSAVTGTQANLVPDSAMQFPNPYWPLAAGMSIGSGGGFGTGNTLVLNCTTPTTIAQPVYFPVAAGQDITLSANISAAAMTAGYALVGLDWVGRGASVLEMDAGAGTAAARYSRTVTVPSGVAQMRIYYGQYASSGNPAGTAYINQIQVEVGSAMTAYRVSPMDVLTAGLQSGINVQEPGGSLSTVVLGDAHARVRTTIGGYGGTGTDNLTSGVDTDVTPNNVGAEGMIANGSFQRGTAGWTSGDANGIDVQSSNPPVAGMNYLHVHTTVANTGATCARKFDVQAGENYKLVGWLYGTNAYLDFQCEDGAGNDKGDLTAYGSSAGWAYITANVTVPAGATQATLFLAGNAAGDFYFTGINVFRVRGVGSEVWDDGVGTCGYRVRGAGSDNYARWASLYGDTSGDTSTALVDSANKRFLHGAMSTGCQGAITSASQFIGINSITSTASGYQSDLATIHDKSANKNPLNIVIDDDFEAGAGSVGHWSGATFSVVSVTGQSFGHALQALKTTTGYDLSDGNGELDFPVKGGEWLWVQFWLNSTSSTTAGNFGLMTGEGGSTTASYTGQQWPGIAWTAATGWTFYSGWIQLEANACIGRVYMAWHPAVNDTIQFAQLYIGRMRPTPVLGYVDADGMTVNQAVLGQSGATQLSVGTTGSWTLSGGAVGRQIRQVIVTAPTTAGYNDGATIDFSALTRQGGAALPTFGTFPDVGLIAYNPPSGLNELWASNITTTGFTLNAKDVSSASVQNTVGMSSLSTSGGTSTGSYTVPTGDTATQVQISVSVHAATYKIGGTTYAPFSVGVTPTVDGTAEAAFNVTGQTNGGTYNNSAAYGISVTAGNTVSLSVAVTGPGSTYVSSITCHATVTTTGGTVTSVNGVNFYAIIGEEWAG